MSDPIIPASPDTLTDSDLIQHKEQIAEKLKELRPGERRLFTIERQSSGVFLKERRLQSNGMALSENLLNGRTAKSRHFYSLSQLPATTDPLWLSSIVSRIPGNFQVFVGVKGCEPLEIKKRIEHSRRRNSRDSSFLSNIDQEVTFEESSQVLKSLSRGEECVVEFSLLIISESKLDLDPDFFYEEKNKELSLASQLGRRKRFHRSFFIRVVSASDLIPTLLDPKEDGLSVLSTVRGGPLFFSPQDSRLEALHWIVVGASGSGKSFFTGLILRRMIQAGNPMSVLFVDHNRSFRRVVNACTGAYFEPKTLESVGQAAVQLFDTLNLPGSMTGIELSDLTLDEKKIAGKDLLSKVELFLRHRDTTHPVYVVLDECWNFMRDNPVLVQRAFREFRKLNGAAVAITQSISDFITDESGQSILQNAPVRILLRQGEDLDRYQGILGLNSKELEWTKLLKQRKGHFSECLIKTPFLSKVGRLYPTEAEHALLRTDNIRQELIEESREKLARRKRGALCELSL